MFDPVTAKLIRSIGGLEGLNSSRLPELLTQAFTEIVSARIRLGEVPADNDAINKAIDRFSRLGNTLEPWVLLEPQRENAAAVAYVAAQSHLIVEMGLALSRERIRGHLAMDSISPAVSAMLLFLIANQPSDSAGVAARIKVGRKGATALLLRDLVSLATGELAEVALSPPESVGDGEDPLEQASVILYARIRRGVRMMARRLLGLPVTKLFDPDRIFARVAEDALHRFSSENGTPFGQSGDQLFSAFPGPFQLASLLRGVWATILKAAIVNLPSPAGVDPLAWRRMLRPILPHRPYLWPNHLGAIEGGMLDPGKSAVLTFPTGAGKSTLGELKIAATLCKGRHVLYLAPTHALVAQVKSNLRGVFGRTTVSDALPADEFYAETDDGENPEAVVTVMTPERCLASVGIHPDGFQQLGLVVFDECHLIHPKGDGQNRRSLDAMLTVLNLFAVAPEADWLLISAMLANGAEIAQWIEAETKRPCLAFKLDWKPTRQARGSVVFKGSDVDRLAELLQSAETEATRKKDGTLPAPPVAVQRLLTADAYSFVCLQQTWQTKFLNDYTLIRLLDEPIPLAGALSPNKRGWRLRANKNEVAAQVGAQCAKLGFKVLLFAQQRDHTASIANLLSDQISASMAAPVLDDVARHLLRVATDEVGAADDLYVDPNLRATCHHALMIPAERDFAERVFRARDGLNALAATPTLAQGINLPADIVIIVGEERFDKNLKRNVPIDAHEILNAAGRAGRAGHVAQGLVLVVPNDIIAYRFSKTENKLGGSWASLQAVFAQNDQCLTARDPVQHMLDLVQVGAKQSDADVLYFLRRLPLDTAETPDRTAGVLRRSFGAFLARSAVEKKDYEAKIKVAISARKEVGGKNTDWRAEIASLAGVTTAFVESIDAALNETAPPEELEPLVAWFFSWLAANRPLLADALGYRLARFLQKGDGQLPLFDALSADATWAWMTGKNLREVGEALAQGRVGKRAKEGREFALWAIPEISFAMGVVAQVQRRRIEEELTDSRMTAALATAGLCIREGCPSPEVAALRLHFSGVVRSRRELIRLWAEIQPNAGGAGSPYEKFGQIRRRVTRALLRTFPAE